MTEQISDELIEATWLFCRKQLIRAEDAEDAAQEILCEALRAIRSGREIDRFYGWYWAMRGGRLRSFCDESRPASSRWR